MASSVQTAAVTNTDLRLADSKENSTTGTYGNPPPKPAGSQRSRPAKSDAAIMLAANARFSVLSQNMQVEAPVQTARMSVVCT